MKSVFFVAVVGIVSALSFTDASAAPTNRSEVVNAAGICQPFTPSTYFRTSAGGVRNIGTTTMYVTCAQSGDWTDSTTVGTIAYDPFFFNAGTETVTIGCYLRPGYSGDGTGTSGGSYAKTVTLAPGQGNYIIYDAGTLIGVGGRFANPTVTCGLPKSVTMGFAYWVYDEEIGS